MNRLVCVCDCGLTEEVVRYYLLCVVQTPYQYDVDIVMIMLEEFLLQGKSPCPDNPPRRSKGHFAFTNHHHPRRRKIQTTAAEPATLLRRPPTLKLNPLAKEFFPSSYDRYEGLNNFLTANKTLGADGFRNNTTVKFGFDRFLMLLVVEI
nr:polyadenylate-binding protein-interacting protein 8-like [Ipomoea batatas]